MCLYRLQQQTNSQVYVYEYKNSCCTHCCCSLTHSFCFSHFARNCSNSNCRAPLSINSGMQTYFDLSHCNTKNTTAPLLHCYTCAQNFSILFPVTVGIILGHVCGSVKLMIVKKVKWLSRLATAHKSTVVAVNTHTDTYSHTLTHMQAWKSE